MTTPGFFSDFAPQARTGLLLGAALLLAGFLAAMWWLLAPSYGLLFGNLRETDAAEVSQSLTEWKVPHRFVDGGAGIEVPDEQVYELRMKLVSAGVPSGGHVGFELFDDADFGVTEFAQRVNYQRAMQGELERSIGALPGVESARVHLTIRRAGLFIGQKDSSKASVALSLAPGAVLPRAQVVGIRNLVASAVDGLDPAAVVVLGPDGALAGGGAVEPAMDQAEGQSAYEKRVQQRVSDLLSQAFRLRDFRVSVDVRMNFDQVRRVSERLLAQGDAGNGLVTRRRTSSSGAAATADAGAAAAPRQEQDEIEYAHGTEREEVAQAPGRVERISVAILVPADVDTFQLARLRKLVIVAAGLDEQRGDRLEIGAFEGPNKRAAVPSVQSDAESGFASAGDEPARGLEAMPAYGWLALVGVLGLLLGYGVASVRQGARAPMRAGEREAVLTRMRAWLAEGEGA